MLVTEEQQDVIRALFEHNSWDSHQTVPQDVPGGARTLESNIDMDTDDSPSTQHILISQDEEEQKCQHCLCSPCITSDQHKQFWWADLPESPKRTNSKLRKTAYRKFWTMLYHRGIWNSQDYKDRKTRSLGYDPDRSRCIYHRRDIMPVCVITCVRQWYPNPVSVPYMGHMWE